LNFETRGGNIGEVGSKWDNRFYTSATVFGCKVNFLIDSESTASIFSNIVFDTMNTENNLLPDPRRLSEVSGNEIPTYGSSCLLVTIGSQTYQQRFIVCNIHQEAILGQDLVGEKI
jgi:hypothetical protein